jgi:hypothetical protein
MSMTASVVSWSECLASDPEVLCSIPGATRFPEKWWMDLERGPLRLVRIIQELFMVEEHCLLGCFHGDFNYRYLLGLCTV